MTDIQPKIEALTLSQVLNMFHQKIRGLFIEKYNVTAEISEIQTWATMRIFKLVEQTRSSQRITVSAKLLNNNFTKATEFEELTGKELAAGMNVSMLVRLDYNKRYNQLDLMIESFDPNYSVGQLEIQRRLLCKELKELQLWDKNRNLTTPTDFFKIAVIAGKETQGYKDFMAHAGELKKLSLLRTITFDVSMQGEKMESSICDALRKSERFHQEHGIDAIIIIRGGGDGVNLDELNNRNIALLICNSPVPVFVGVGHENDRTILDDIANKSFGTPSKVIEFIKQSIATSSDAVFHDLQKLERTIDLRLSSHERINREKLHKISSYAERHLNRKDEVLNRELRKITVCAQSHIDQSTATLISTVKNIESTLHQQISSFDNKINKQIYELRDKTAERIHKIEAVHLSKPVRAICINAKSQALKAKQLALQNQSHNPAVAYIVISVCILLAYIIGFFVSGVQIAVVLAGVSTLLGGTVLLRRHAKRKSDVNQIEASFRDLLLKIEHLESAINY